MNKNEYRNKYNKNIEVLKKLNIILDKTKKGIDTGFELNVIEDAIEKIEKEQDFYIKQLKRKVYNRYGKKFTYEKKYELYQPEFIERENEIIIQPNSLDEYVTEIIDEPDNKIEESVTIHKSCDDKTDVLTSNKTCDDKTDVLTSDKTCDDKTDVLTSDKTCDDKTDVLTSDKTCDDKTDVLTSDNKVNEKTKKSKFNKLKVALANIAAAAILLIGGVGISGKLNKEKDNENSNDSRIEYTTESTKEEVTSINDMEIEEIKEVPNTEKDNINNIVDIEIANNDITENIEVEEDVKIGDIVSFENTDLYYASTDEKANGNTDIINNQNCEVTMISVVYQGESLDVITDKNASVIETRNEYQEKYGDDVQIFINSNVVDNDGNVISNDLGWVNKNNSKIKVLK